MFTGIVESLGEIQKIESENTNIHFWVKSSFTTELKIDQSIAHNGVCLTVVDIEKNLHKVTAIDETLQKTNLNLLKVGDFVNLERCMQLSARIDGHLVQGHVDDTAECIHKESADGSWIFTFRINEKFANLMVEKGSICVNGISLTCFNITHNTFSVGIIPYTYEHTNIQFVKEKTLVNIEFDIIGKYVQRNNEISKK